MPMPRVARIAPLGYIYHILTRGNNRQDIFKVEEDYEKFIDIVGSYKDKYIFKLYHYALMPNHVHLVLEPVEEGGSLAEVMKGINLSYAQYYKKSYRHIGHFWQDRYKSILISRDDYLLACGSYVELNPVRAGIVGSPEDYRWSSYKVYAYGNKESVIDEHPIYKELSTNETARRKRYREFVEGMIKARNAMEGEMDRRMIYGNKNFTDVIKKKYELAALIKPKGRPKKEEEKR